MTLTEVAGFAGVGLAGAAYVPQISHLIRARCSAGISRLAFEAWLLASVLTTARAVGIGDAVFVVLGGIQIVATTLIMLYAARYKDAPCPSHHLPAQGDDGRRWPGNGYLGPSQSDMATASRGGPAANVARPGKSRRYTEIRTTHLKGTT